MAVLGHPVPTLRARDSLSCSGCSSEVTSDRRRMVTLGAVRRQAGRIDEPKLKASGLSDRHSLRHLRHGCDEALRVSVARFDQNLFGETGLYHPAFVQDRNSIANAGYGCKIVRNVKKGHSEVAVQGTRKVEGFLIA